MAPDAWVASWRRGRFHCSHTLRRPWVEAGPVRFWVRTVWYVLGSVIHVPAPAEGHLNVNTELGAVGTHPWPSHEQPEAAKTRWSSGP